MLLCPPCCRYAALDAHAAVLIFRGLGKLHPPLRSRAGIDKHVFTVHTHSSTKIAMFDQMGIGSRNFRDDDGGNDGHDSDVIAGGRGSMYLGGAASSGAPARSPQHGSARGMQTEAVHHRLSAKLHDTLCRLHQTAAAGTPLFHRHALISRKRVHQLLIKSLSSIT
jgi:hypothetical protein